MKLKFNLYERVAGLFVLVAIVGALAATVAVAIKKGWFEDKVHLVTDLKNADGVREGTVVQMAGLRAGRVNQVALKTNNEIMVKFEVSERFADRVRADSVVRVIRPFIIGEKVLDISVGSETERILAENDSIKSEATMDIMDLVSGKTLGPSLETLGKMMENLKFVAEELFDPERSKAIVEMFDDVRPLLRNANVLTAEAAGMLKKINKKDQVVRMVGNLAVLTDELALALPVIRKESPQLASDLAKIAKNMAVLTDEVSKTLPLMKDVAPEIPRASRRAIEALDETVVTLKALQKSFLLRSNVREVRSEEAERERKPASTGTGEKPEKDK
ncbi:MAG: MlaD family protein [Bdellovibrionota bacterium]